ncbi:mitochondrial ATP-independent inner membrane protease subunit 1a-like [Lycium ferocissimum]|uniref:mitochondrial ATP-independent inner membrane protease subunit 1a-like n=1 Tax=Lycium ferocissimum TaxID=112874 RepID=UPI002815FCAF|nr:mitochondrial ATP-independent inner membrane protease subunit 1a-like [Lycium ferocissimum]
MGLGNLKQLTPFIKEAFQQTLVVSKFLCGLHVTNNYICTFALTQGPSMLPTFNLTGDLVLAERISTRFEKMKRGDVVLVRSPENPRKIVIKRLIGMGGDTVRYVVDHGSNDKEHTVVVPDGHVWIEGDNKFNTNDSRKFGPVPYGLVQGRVFWTVWPPEDFGSVGREVR